MWNWRAKNARKRSNKAIESERVVEHLETRALLAGNVVASLNGSHLTVTGDAADNAIDITVLNGGIQLREGLVWGAPDSGVAGLRTGETPHPG